MYVAHRDRASGRRYRAHPKANKKCPLIPWDEEAFVHSWFHPPAAQASYGVRCAA